jgi:hypothetical protein
MVSRFQLIVLLKKPIEPYLPAGGKLIVLGPTEPVMIVLKLGFTVGLVLASPVIIYQIWAFLSPALYARERKALVPGLLIGLLLFMTGAVLGYIYVVPQTLPSAVQFPVRSPRPVHYIRQLLQLPAPGGAGAGNLVRIAADHHPALDLRHSHAGRAQQVPPLCHRAGLLRRSRFFPPAPTSSR